MKFVSLLIAASMAALPALVACGGSEDPAPGRTDTSSTKSDTAPGGGASDGASSSSGAMVSWPSAQAAAASCNWNPGMFACGDTECNRETHFCAEGAPVLGTSCKAVGGTGTTCPNCATILAIAKEVSTCGALTPSCAGDERSGVTITCR